MKYFQEGGLKPSQIILITPPPTDDVAWDFACREKYGKEHRRATIIVHLIQNEKSCVLVNTNAPQASLDKGLTNQHATFGIDIPSPFALTKICGDWAQGIQRPINTYRDVMPSSSQVIARTTLIFFEP